jgi:hypothetical protein
MEIYTIIITLLSLIILMLGYTTFNLLRKNEKQEDILASYLNYLDKLSKTIEISKIKLKEIDEKGIFEKDDDVGVIFSSILKIQDILNEFILKEENLKENAKEEK